MKLVGLLFFQLLLAFTFDLVIAYDNATFLLRLHFIEVTIEVKLKSNST